MSLQENFTTWCNVGAGKEKKTKMTQTQLNKWMKDAGVFKTAADAQGMGIWWSKHFKTAKDVDFKGLEAALKNHWPDSVAPLTACTGPNLKGTTGVSKTGNVSGMTDTSKYTGAHKERFNEDGTGKGAEGREDKVDNTGYVGNYKGEGTYEEKH